MWFIELCLSVTGFLANQLVLGSVSAIVNMQQLLGSDVGSFRTKVLSYEVLCFIWQESYQDRSAYKKRGITFLT